MAENVVTVLKDQAKRGRTVVATVHQPSSEVFAMFDRVILLAEGRVAFTGTLPRARDFFAR
jgi:ABC-type multidrug transport system ATPase subunit